MNYHRTTEIVKDILTKAEILKNLQEQLRLDLSPNIEIIPLQQAMNRVTAKDMEKSCFNMH